MKSNIVLTAMEKLVLIKIYTLVIATACCVCVCVSFLVQEGYLKYWKGTLRAQGRKEKQKQQTLLIIIP